MKLLRSMNYFLRFDKTNNICLCNVVTQSRINGTLKADYIDGIPNNQIVEVLPGGLELVPASKLKEKKTVSYQEH